MQIRDLTGKGEVIKRRIKEGTGQFPMDCPIQDSKVRIHYRCTSAPHQAYMRRSQAQPLQATAMALICGACNAVFLEKFVNTMCYVHSHDSDSQPHSITVSGKFYLDIYNSIVAFPNVATSHSFP